MSFIIVKARYIGYDYSNRKFRSTLYAITKSKIRKMLIKVENVFCFKMFNTFEFILFCKTNAFIKKIIQTLIYYFMNTFF